MFHAFLKGLKYENRYTNDQVCGGHSTSDGMASYIYFVKCKMVLK